MCSTCLEQHLNKSFETTLPYTRKKHLAINNSDRKSSQNPNQTKKAVSPTGDPYGETTHSTTRQPGEAVSSILGVGDLMVNWDRSGACDCCFRRFFLVIFGVVVELIDRGGGPRKAIFV